VLGHLLPARRGILPAAAALVCALLLALPATADAARRLAGTAALQVALRAEGVYGGDVDGIRGPGTAAAVRAFQRRAGLPADGVAGRRTRRALGTRGRPGWGTRVLRQGAAGWDVAALQFRLAIRGFPSGPIDGGFGARTSAAVQRFQAYAGLPVDGVVGPGTRRAFARTWPRSLLRVARPVAAPLGDRFGPRGDRMHAGVDFTADTGAPVAAARSGVVARAGWDASGFGNVVVLRHGAGVQTLYAHLSSIAVRQGQSVAGGALVGRVGATGRSTGPHLHFEVLHRGANVDPLTAMG